MLEYEKKIILTADEYLSVSTRMCKHLPLRTQTNYYFDNNNLSMNKNGITCRIRAKDGKYKATIKNHNTGCSDCSIEVDLIEKSELDPQIFNALGLHYQGELVTDRIVVYKDATCEMILDRNVYLGHTDFELEVEYCKESERRAQALIESVIKCLDLKNRPADINEFLERVGQGGSKSQRFFERLQSRK